MSWAKAGWAGVLMLCQAMGGMAWAQSSAFSEKLADKALLAQLRLGGYVLYMRHAMTDNSRADQVPHVDLRDCLTQRVLSPEGQTQARTLGQYFQESKIPISEVVHSPMCRTRHTAELAFSYLKTKPKSVPALIYSANLTAEQKRPLLAETRRWLSLPVPVGSNRVIVSHAPNLADLMGYFVKPEGTVAVIRPLGGGQFQYVASIPPDLWPQLLK